MSNKMFYIYYMTKSIITTKAFDISIFEIDQEKGMVNLTKIAAHFNKEVSNWLKSKATKEFLREFALENPDLPNGGIGIDRKSVV